MKLTKEEAESIYDFCTNQFISYENKPKNRLYNGGIVHTVLDKIRESLDGKG